MTRQEITYFSDEIITKMFLSDAQLHADRNEAITEGKQDCNSCVLSGHLTTWGEMVINCTARSFDSLEEAIDQENSCKRTHTTILENIAGQTEVYLRDA